MPAGLNYVVVNGGAYPAPCIPDPTEGGRFDRGATVWAELPNAPKTGAVQGLVTDKDGDPVDGVTINAYGMVNGHPGHVSATSGPGGLYYMTVAPGSYRVVPDAPALKRPTFTPVYSSVTVVKSHTATANFQLNSGLELRLSLGKTSVSADGYHVVKGVISTSEFAKPKANIAVQLTIVSSDVSNAASTAPPATLCGPSGRVLPSGPIDCRRRQDRRELRRPRLW
jgi:hypothetical protein